MTKLSPTEDNQRYLYEALALAHIGHFKANPATGQVEGSDEFYRMFGWAKDAIDFDTAMEAILPNDQEHGRSFIDKVLAEGLGWDKQFSFLGWDGKEKTIRSIAKSIACQDGNTPVLVGTVQDITRNKRTESALMESEQRYRLFVENYLGIAFQAKVDWNFFWRTSRF